jgi:magnesium-transporting ATPase (P-type)
MTEKTFNPFEITNLNQKLSKKEYFTIILTSLLQIVLLYSIAETFTPTPNKQYILILILTFIYPILILLNQKIKSISLLYPILIFDPFSKLFEIIATHNHSNLTIIYIILSIICIILPFLLPKKSKKTNNKEKNTTTEKKQPHQKIFKSKAEIIFAITCIAIILYFSLFNLLPHQTFHIIKNILITIFITILALLGLIILYIQSYNFKSKISNPKTDKTIKE